jgi:hypothetical protein
LPNNDGDDTTDDALHSGHPVWHAPQVVCHQEHHCFKDHSHQGRIHSGDIARRRWKIFFARWWWCRHWWCPSFEASYLACTWWTCKRLR